MMGCAVYSGEMFAGMVAVLAGGIMVAFSGAWEDPAKQRQTLAQGLAIAGVGTVIAVHGVYKVIDKGCTSFV